MRRSQLGAVHRQRGQQLVADLPVRAAGDRRGEQVGLPNRRGAGEGATRGIVNTCGSGSSGDLGHWGVGRWFRGDIDRTFEEPALVEQRAGLHQRH